MNLPQDRRSRLALAGAAAVVALVLVLIAAIALAGDDGERTALAPTATSIPRPTMTVSPPAAATIEPTANAIATAEPSPATALATATAPAPTTPPIAGPPTSPPATAPPTVAPCTATLQAAIDAAEAGATLDLRACTFDGTARVTKALTLIGGTLRSQTTDRQAKTLSIEADNVTIDGWTFRGGGNVISVVGRTNVRILNNSFRDHTGGAIGLWGAVRSIDISGNDIVNASTFKTGIVGGRGSEGSNPCPAVGRNVTIRNNNGDQGAGSIGWFGIELKCFEDVLIEGNRLRGGSVLISLPDSNRVTIRGNTLDLTGSAYWGVEIPKANNVVIEYNTVFGDGPQNDTAFSANSGSQGLIVRFNKVQNVLTLVDGPLGALVTDNCINGVTNISAHGVPETSTIERNIAC